MDADTLWRSLFALIFVLILIAGLAWVGRRFGLTPRAGRKTDNHRRLAIVEVLPVDGKRRLLLLRRDDTEHLVLLGATNETVVETGIQAPARRPQTPASDRARAGEARDDS